MKQLSFAASEFAKKPKQTRREKFLLEMDAVVPWSRLLSVIEPYYPKAGNGRRPYELPTMLRIHFMQQWFGFADAAMEEALHEIPLLRHFAGLDAGTDTMPDETTILEVAPGFRQSDRPKAGSSRPSPPPAPPNTSSTPSASASARWAATTPSTCTTARVTSSPRPPRPARPCANMST